MYTIRCIRSIIILVFVVYYGQLLWSVDTESLAGTESTETQSVYSTLCKRITPKNGQALQLSLQIYTQLLEKDLVEEDTVFYNHEQNMLYVKSTHMQPPMRAIDFIKIMIQNHFVTARDIERLIHNYKIHIMPAEGQLIPTMVSVAALLKKDTQFARTVPCVKLFPDYEKTSLSNEVKNSERIPGIILYVPSCKKHAQHVLNTLYTELKEVSGANKCPRFSGQVTDLLFVAQGNGDEKEKIGRGYEKIYEGPDKIYYNLAAFFPHYTEQSHLHHPRTLQAITTSYQPSEAW